jgi:hypothetical protein
MTSFHRTDWPGRSVTFWTMPFRLLRIPSTATRCAIGVTPPCPAAVAGAFVVTGAASFCCDACFAQAARASAIVSDAASFLTLIRGSRARNRPWRPA